MVGAGHMDSTATSSNRFSGLCEVLWGPCQMSCGAVLVVLSYSVPIGRMCNYYVCLITKILYMPFMDSATVR